MRSKAGEHWISIFREAVNKCLNDVPKLIRSKSGTKIYNIKQNNDPTIKAELYAEDVLFSILSREKIPVEFYSEERGYLLQSPGAKYLVLLDPIDGTFLALRNLSGASIGISVLDLDTMEPLAAMVGDYYSKDVYWATNAGALRNGKPMRPSRVQDLDQAFISTCYGKMGRFDLMLAGKGLVKPFYRLNITAGILSMVWVGAGQVDAHFDLMLGHRPYDFVAGAYIAGIAGAIVTNEQGEKLIFTKDVNKRYKFIIAANKKLHAQILDAHREQEKIMMSK